MARISHEVQALYGLCAVALVERRADLDGADNVGFDIDLPVFSVGRAAQLADIHPQTLRQYDRQGLIVPQRTEGGARRYSLRDVDKLAQAQRMSQGEGINLAGISRILDLQEENRQLRREVERLNRPRGSSVFAADPDGGITEVQRSRQARRWRHDVRARVRELPARPYYRDYRDANADAGAAGTDGAASDSDSNGQRASQAYEHGAVGDGSGRHSSLGTDAADAQSRDHNRGMFDDDPFVAARSMVVWGDYFD